MGDMNLHVRVHRGRQHDGAVVVVVVARGGAAAPWRRCCAPDLRAREGECESTRMCEKETHEDAAGESGWRDGGRGGA